MKKLSFAMIGHGFMGKAHSYALLATPFFFKTGIEPVRKVIVGMDSVLEELLTVVFAGGHCLLEGVPGLAKTSALQIRTSAASLPIRPSSNVTSVSM